VRNAGERRSSVIRAALGRGAAQLPEVELRATQRAIGNEDRPAENGRILSCLMSPVGAGGDIGWKVNRVQSS